MKWSWQKWAGKLVVFVPSALKLVFDLLESGQPQWLVIIVAALPGVVQWLLALMPPKT